VSAHTPNETLDEFDQGWLSVLRRTPFATAIIGLVGLTRLGQRPTDLHRLATRLDQPLDQTEALVRGEFTARIEDGLIHWDVPFPGERTRRTLHVEGRTVPMSSGCAPDLFIYAAVLDVPFHVEETCPTTGTPIRVDFLPGYLPGGVERVRPPETVTVLLAVEDLNRAAGGSFELINTTVCAYQPFFASAQAARPWLAAHPGARVFTIAEMFQRPWLRHYRDTLRPLIHTPDTTRR
jgi:hypothetical protein